MTGNLEKELAMLKACPILNTKLLPPSISDILHRERMDPLFCQLKQKLLITVTAGAGYGKTTLIASVIRELGLKTIWYRLERSDEDFITFLHYLSAGVKKIYPEFGTDIFSYLKSPLDSNWDHGSLLTLFINDLERISSGDLFFVLDDYHTVKGSPEIKNALMFFLDHLPDRIHLVLISRTEIDLPLSRLRAARRVMDITEENLYFSISEIERLFSVIFDISLKKSQTSILFEKTKGWISGLILFYHALKGKSESEMEKLLKNLNGSEKEIFSYLEENIFDQLTSYEKDFLLKTSILSRLDPGFCDELLKINESRDILKRLKTSHLFTLSQEGTKDEYVYNDLFRDYLKIKLRIEVDEKEVYGLHKTAGMLHEKKREYRVALDHYLEAHQMKEACRLIGLLGRRWIKQGRVRRIRFYLEEIPDQYLQQDPWVLYLQAGLMGLSGKPQEAITGYARSLGVFQTQPSDEGVDICMADMATAYYNIGDYKKSESLYKKLLSRNTPPLYLRVICLGYLLSLSYALGKTSDSDRFMEQAKSMLPEIMKEEYGQEIHGWLNVSIGKRLIKAGDLKQAQDILKKTLEILHPTGQYRVLALCHLLLSEGYNRLGLFQKGIDAAQAALNIAREKGLNDGTYPGGLLLLAWNNLGMGRKEEALCYAQDSLARSQETHILHTQASAHMLLFFIHFESGDLRAAEENVRHGMEAIRDLQLPLYQSMLEIYLASIMIEKEEWDEAMRLLRRAETRSLQGTYHQAIIFLKYSHCYMKQDQINQAIKTIRKALSICESYGYDHLLVKQKNWIVALLVMFFSRGEKKDYIRKILAMIGSEAITQLSGIITNSPPPVRNAAIDLFNVLRQDSATGLKVCFFGKFRVVIGEEELPAERWQSKKALNLFKYLIISRHRGYLNKEILMEFLWPNEVPQKSAKRFHVVLASLRKTLEPHIPKGIPSLYILSNGGAYRLDIGEKGWVDIEDFSQELAQAKRESNPEKAIDHCLKALSLYKGDFLDEYLYIDWYTEIREQFKEDYLNALSEIVSYYETGKDFKKCIDYATVYLKKDKYREEIYRVLMRCHSQLGCKAKAIKIYEKCKDNIMTDLNCPLSSETLSLYRQLTVSK